MSVSNKSGAKKEDIAFSLNQDRMAASHIRRDLAIAFTVLLVIIAVMAALQNGAMPVLDKLLPLVAIIFGFFFGHKSNYR
jgi:hypothetical protein